MSAAQRSAQRSFSTSISVELEIGDAPMLAFTFVLLARPIAIGSSVKPRCTLFAGITMRPAAISSRTCSAVRCGSRSATRRISRVIAPSRANSSCVEGSKPAGAVAKPVAALRCQPRGRKSHAVFSDGAGIPGVSGELNVSAPPSCGAFAKLPGVVPWAFVDGLFPNAGN